jgi:hypothetical protein
MENIDWMESTQEQNKLSVYLSKERICLEKPFTYLDIIKQREHTSMEVILSM